MVMMQYNVKRWRRRPCLFSSEKWMLLCFKAQATVLLCPKQNWNTENFVPLLPYPESGNHQLKRFGSLWNKTSGLFYSHNTTVLGFGFVVAQLKGLYGKHTNTIFLVFTEKYFIKNYFIFKSQSVLFHS